MCIYMYIEREIHILCIYSEIQYNKWIYIYIYMYMQCCVYDILHVTNLLVYMLQTSTICYKHIYIYIYIICYKLISICV